MSNTFGRHFRLTTFGESHGSNIGLVIDGCPAGLVLDLGEIESEVARRRPGQSRLSSQRKESDLPEIISGVHDGITTGTPIAILIRNEDQRPKDYENLETVFRPSHADFTWHEKFGIRDHRGGGRSSARETANWVAAGSIAKQFIRQEAGILIEAWVDGVGSIRLKTKPETVDLSGENSSLVRCPDEQLAGEMAKEIELARAAGDSLGGTIACRAKNVPAGLGEPVFGKLHAELGRAMLTINAAKGFETGSGFGGSTMKGSEHNDEFYMEEGRVRTHTNHSGGIQGGISNGEEIFFRVAFKPVSTLSREQKTVNTAGEEIAIAAKGRHDPCVVPRAVPVVEAMAALVLADFLLAKRTNRI